MPVPFFCICLIFCLIFTNICLILQISCGQECQKDTNSCKRSQQGIKIAGLHSSLKQCFPLSRQTKKISLWKPRDHKVQMAVPHVSNISPAVPTHSWLHLIYQTSEINTLKYLGWSHILVPKSLTLQILFWHQCVILRDNKTMEAGIQIYLEKIKALRLSKSQQKYDKKQDREVSLEIHHWKTWMKYLRNFSHGPY